MLPSAASGAAGVGRRVLAGPSLDGAGMVVLQGAERCTTREEQRCYNQQPAMLPSAAGGAAGGCRSTCSCRTWGGFMLPNSHVDEINTKT
jgi:hypothetical protein